MQYLARFSFRTQVQIIISVFLKLRPVQSFEINIHAGIRSYNYQHLNYAYLSKHLRLSHYSEKGAIQGLETMISSATQTRAIKAISRIIFLNFSL